MKRLAAYARTFACFGRDARVFLLTALILGAAMSVYWIDFNLYLTAIGIDRTTIGLLMAASQIAAVAAAFPAAAISDRIGRRVTVAGGIGLMIVAYAGYLTGSLVVLTVCVMVYSVGSQTVQVVQVPYMAEKTEPEHRNEFFAALFAIGNVMNVVAAVGGSYLATYLSGQFGLSQTTGPYQILFIAMIGLSFLALGTVFLLSDDRKRPQDAEVRKGRFGVHILDHGLFVRLLLPGFLTSLGAGQLIPYLNLFVKGKFGLDLNDINVIFAITALGTTVAMLIQPALARRFGKIGSIVLVQGCSIPFLLVLGFSPFLPLVVGAMAIRNSLMNAGSPIFDSFAMGRISPAERGTLAAAMTLLWSLGWAIAGPYYGLLQSVVGFDMGYAIDFVTCITLYSISTFLLWHWFRGSDLAEAETGEGVPGSAAVPAASGSPVTQLATEVESI